MNWLLRKVSKWLDNCKKSYNNFKQKIKMAQEEFEKDTTNSEEEQVEQQPKNTPINEIVSKCLEEKLPEGDYSEKDVEEMKIMVNYRLANPNASYDLIHKFWMKTKQAEGWILGDVKSCEEKTHPALKPFANLSDEQKEKVIKLTTIVDSLK